MQYINTPYICGLWSHNPLKLAVIWYTLYWNKMSYYLKGKYLAYHVLHVLRKWREIWIWSIWHHMCLCLHPNACPCPYQNFIPIFPIPENNNYKHRNTNLKIKQKLCMIWYYARLYKGYVQQKGTKKHLAEKLGGKEYL